MFGDIIKMKLISINLTELQLEIIQKLVKIKLYPNKSEAIRSLLNNSLEKKISLISKNNEEYLKYFNLIIENKNLSIFFNKEPLLLDKQNNILNKD